jgi:AcrR family transcriptional regulator
MSDTKQRILEAAARLFHEQGFGATGISAILNEAGVNPGSLYHFFPGKEALLLGVLEWYERAFKARVVEPIEADEPDALRRIDRLLRWYRAQLDENGCRLGCPVGNLALEVTDASPRVRMRLQRNFDEWAGVVERWLVAAGDRLPPDCDRPALARYILSVMEGGVMQARVSGSLAPYDATVQQLVQHLGALERSADAPSVAVAATA